MNKEFNEMSILKVCLVPPKLSLMPTLNVRLLKMLANEDFFKEIASFAIEVNNLAKKMEDQESLTKLS